ncbi:pentapeptide repeat-containing protein [Streptomyces asoensis]|uniref:pentapeptide repeat-containing protein n=1 Tax=Streptomyces asoensis TaxID=249586 RepID=UPI0033F69F51
MGSQSFLHHLRVALARPERTVPERSSAENTLVHQVQVALARQSPAFAAVGDAEVAREGPLEPKDTDVSPANLEGADLTSATLQQADLRRANLTGANLTSADLRMTDLRGANLTGANLTSADLRLADLRDANFECAVLVSADMRGAYIGGINLSGAIMTSVDMRDVRMVHSGPSDTQIAVLPSATHTDDLDDFMW